jgi:hypothetical protein
MWQWRHFDTEKHYGDWQKLFAVDDDVDVVKKICEVLKGEILQI